jgi:hypothetical protein
MKCLGCGKPITKSYGQWSAGYTCSHACNETYIKEFRRNVQKPQVAEATRVAKQPLFRVNHDSEGRY